MTAAKAEPLAAPVYLETSALVKLFVAERDSDRLNRSLAGLDDVLISDLTLTELSSSLGRRVREGQLAPARARRVYRDAHELAASCRRVELNPDAHRLAERLLLVSPLTLRTLDALHLALALASAAATVVSYDLRLREAARSHSLFVAPDAPI